MGMRHLNFDLDLQFDDPRVRWFSEQVLLFGLNILSVRDLFFLRENPGTPKLYDSGLVYLLPEQLERKPSSSQLAAFDRFLSSKMGMGKKEIAHHIGLAKGVEIFRDIPRIIENGGGDCDNLAAWCAAERVFGGAKCVRPYITSREQGGRIIYHALVKWPDGSSEDPSLILGMGGKAKAAERREECRKNVERYDNYWQDAKRTLASETFSSDADRLARAHQFKAAIDAVGLLPKDGIFRVGRPSGAAVVAPSSYRESSMIGLDAFAARRALPAIRHMNRLLAA